MFPSLRQPHWPPIDTLSSAHRIAATIAAHTQTGNGILFALTCARHLGDYPVARNAGAGMPFRSLNADPEELDLLRACFDAAWAELDELGVIDIERDQPQRERLSYIIIGLWKDKGHDLVRESVRRFLAPDASTDAAPDHS
jgi:hypothetical protein